MPPRRFENRSPEPGSRRWSFLDEEKSPEEEEKEQPTEKIKEAKPKVDEKKPGKLGSKKEDLKQEKAKTKELSPEEKLEKRTEAIERSQALKNKFEETPLPSDPSTVARLIVAEHILNIDEQLQDPEASDNAKTKQRLEATLDYMCELAEKLETPALDSPPHIQEAYEALMELTQEALETSDTPDELVKEAAEALQLNLAGANDDSTQGLTTPAVSPGHTSSTSPTTMPKSPVVAQLITYLQAASPQAAPVSAPGNPYSSSSSIAGAPIGTNPPRSFSRPEAATPETKISKMHDTREHHQATRPRAMLPLASVALTRVAAANIHKSPQMSHRHEYSPYSPTPENHSPAPISAPHFDQKPTIETKTAAFHKPNNMVQANVERNHTAHAAETVPSSGKLEHLPLLSLLALAKDIHVGHGRYLKDEFEHGRIDREGLVKVLKARKKGLDYSQEFSKQAATFRQRLESIEFITKPPKPTTVGNNYDDAPVEHHIIPDQPHEQTSQKDEFTHPILERYAHPERSFFQPPRKNPIPISLIVTILAIMTFGILIFFFVLPV